MQSNRRERKERREGEEGPHKLFCFFIRGRPESAGKYQGSAEPRRTKLSSLFLFSSTSISASQRFSFSAFSLIGARQEPRPTSFVTMRSAFLDQLPEPGKQRRRIMRARGGFGMILDTEDGLVLVPHSLDGLVV